MLYFFRLLFFSINIDQETILNWFGIKNPNNFSTFSPLKIDETDYKGHLLSSLRT